MSNQTTQQQKANAVFQRSSVDTWKNIADTVIDTTEKTVKFYDDSFNAFVQFNTNQIESWFATFKNVKN
uniref:Uncharacterized protein n=1 Tax=uncultured archaeon W4-93a TaxID=1131007 RepID=H9BWX8_9ARCH|nr:hypothetical protein [uncultured archaeon W4-93a]